MFIFFVFTGSVQATELELLKSFFGHSGVSDKKSVYHGEMLTYYVNKPTLGKSLPKDAKANFREVFKTQNSAAYAVLLSQGEKTQDWYAFLVRANKKWKISAIRTLAIPGLFYLGLKELENKTSRTTEEEWKYQNMLLTIKRDKDLKDYLKSHIDEFNKIVSSFKSGNKEASKKMAKKLLIDSVKTENGIYKLLTGGIMDNSVGFMFIPSDVNQPIMEPEELIYLENIVSNWYIYKTT